ncbi:MAG: hypothetical protein AVDCRST_MAG57-2613, partial [uncultured Blastococcus sp.]
DAAAGARERGGGPRLDSGLPAARRHPRGGRRDRPGHCAGGGVRSQRLGAALHLRGARAGPRGEAQAEVGELAGGPRPRPGALGGPPGPQGHGAGRPV